MANDTWIIYRYIIDNFSYHLNLFNLTSKVFISFANDLYFIIDNIDYLSITNLKISSVDHCASSPTPSVVFDAAPRPHSHTPRSSTALPRVLSSPPQAFTCLVPLSLPTHSWELGLLRVPCQAMAVYANLTLQQLTNTLGNPTPSPTTTPSLDGYPWYGHCLPHLLASPAQFLYKNILAHQHPRPRGA